MTSSVNNDKLNDSTTESSIQSKLIESGKREELRKKLEDRFENSEWKADLQTQCLELIGKHADSEDYTLERLVNEMVPRAFHAVPHILKQELIKDIQVFLEKEAMDD
ncbi:unnamed protein product [Lepeophtheirus salmonis]|uniref:Transcription and mRNA export factor ENY2 n=1 Tax=Lepeophtheirus salmonis TaxID=72036 RepID=A0A7R8DB03_LEPSM|nr:unnamed protein product [Lepeophtheirus salmonis]CAF3030293.1 unnamed protein product [Lepeophtheirus salmonis]